MKFVWAKDLEKEMNVTLAFVWQAQKAYQDVAFYLCGAQAYRVFKNGELLGCGPYRAAHGYARKDCFSIENIEAGDIFVAEVASYNIRCLSTVGKTPYFAAEIVMAGMPIAQTQDFVCYRMTDRKQRVLRQSFQRAFVESYQMRKCRTCFYRGEFSMFKKAEMVEVSAPALLPVRMQAPNYSQVFVPSPIERGNISYKEEYTVWRDRAHQITDIFDGFPLNELEEDVSEEVCKMQFASVRNSASKHYRAGQYGVYSFDRTLSGFYHIRLHAYQETELYLIYDEVDSNEGGKGIDIDFKRNDTCNIIKFQLKKGDYDLRTFEPFSVRHTRLCVTAGHIEVKTFGFVLFENSEVYKNKFLIADKELSLIVEAAQNTLAQNSVDFLMDCPSRERAGWVNDAYFSGRAEYALTGKNTAYYNLVENYALSPALPELAKGMIPMCYPGDFPNNDFIPNCGFWFILDLYDYTRRMPDPRLIELCRKKVYGILSYFSDFENEVELLENLKGWIFIEWSATNWKHFVRGVNFPCNMTYCKALECVGKLYGDSALLEKSARIKARIKAMSFNGEFFVDNAERDENGRLVRTENTTETCQYFAFYMGIADKVEYHTLYKTLIDKFGYTRGENCYPNVHPSNALIGFLLRLELLRQDKNYPLLLTEVKGYYLNMAKKTGTLWEHKNVKASLNHGFASYVGVFILEALGFIPPLFDEKE